MPVNIELIECRCTGSSPTRGVKCRLRHFGKARRYQGLRVFSWAKKVSMRDKIVRMTVKRKHVSDN